MSLLKVSILASIVLVLYLLLNSTLNHYISLYNDTSSYFNRQGLFSHLSESDEVSSETIIDSNGSERLVSSDEIVSGNASVRSESNSNSRTNTVSAITHSHTTGTGIANAIASSSSNTEVADHSSNAENAAPSARH